MLVRFQKAFQSYKMVVLVVKWLRISSDFNTIYVFGLDAEKTAGFKLPGRKLFFKLELR